MEDDKVAQSGSEVESNQPNSLQIGVHMQQGEHTGQPIYSNFTAVQRGQGVVLVDFGFLDPKALQSLAQMTKSGDEVPETINARMSSRVAISIDAAVNLSRQLNQLLHPKAAKTSDTEQQGADVDQGGDVTLQ